MTRPEALKFLLLDMISSSRPVAPAMMSSLSDADWRFISDVARQHRLGPMLHHNLKAKGSDWVVPDGIGEIWASAYGKSALRSLAARSTLARLNAILDAASIPYAALKGAWLFLHSYPDPALRPLRDIDIVVSPPNALAVYGLLEQNGFVRPDGVARPGEYALEHAKHLPSLRCLKTGTSVEIHTRLIDDFATKEMLGTIGDTSALMQRIERHDGIAFLPPTDTMLHLVVHAVYDHHFNNGPLTLNDIALLAASPRIEWDRFWAMAETGGWVRGCELTFAMVQHYHDQVVLPERPGASHDFAPMPEQLESALLLTLQDFAQRGIVGFRGEMMAEKSFLGRVSLLWRRAFPKGHLSAALAGSPSAARWILGEYPKWLFSRVTQLLFERPRAEAADEARRAAVVENWLRGTR